MLAVPTALHYFSVLIGSHFYPVSKALTTNKSVPMGLTNFSLSATLNIKGKPVICSETIAGGLQGDFGITIAALIYGNEVGIGVSAEAGIISQEELKQFVKFLFLSQEIRSLFELTHGQNLEAAAETFDSDITFSPSYDMDAEHREDNRIHVNSFQLCSCNSYYNHSEIFHSENV